MDRITYNLIGAETEWRLALDKFERKPTQENKDWMIKKLQEYHDLQMIYAKSRTVVSQK